MTFAAEMRAAARIERDEWDSETCRKLAPQETAIHLALADWLDHTAALIEGNKRRFEGTQSSGMALLTARAINDGAS
jgi:uncharacterized protein (DUF934 family)